MNTNFINQSAIDWIKKSGILLIYNLMKDRSKLEELWANWKKMPRNLQLQSDKKCIELYGCNNEKHYLMQLKQSKYDGFPFILHLHNPRNGSEHNDLRFLDLHNNKLLHSFALPDNWKDNINKTVLFKTRDHDPRWLTLESYRLKTLDKGYMDYKIYKPYGYFLLHFHGKILNGVFQIFKLRDKIRKDVWMMLKK